MPTFHIDLVNGNDANTGLSWAQAWRTFTNGATAARIAPGDDIKVSKTADPTSIGTATWTNEKIGNSITFATAPTKLIDTAKSGWVSGGSGSTVTNANTTAYMTPISFGGTTYGALQWTTSATANGCYKDIGSTQNFSAHQQVSFWFRTTVALDCTGVQNLIIELCSDSIATTVVNTLTAPKWSYAANTWYPIVIDNASALSSTVRSIRFHTSSATSQTFYVDEIFASPANGLTLWSLIGLNNNVWYPIRCVRDADVCLLAGFNASNAQGAVGQIAAIDSSWMGTTQTATTWKLEPSRSQLPSTGPSSSSYGVNNTESATAAQPRRISGGWNTSTDTIDGETWLDGVTHISSSIGLFSVSTPFVICENFGVVRFANAYSNQGNYFAHNCHFVACGPTINSTSTHDSTFIQNIGLFELTIKSIIGCNGGVGFQSNGRTKLSKFNFNEVWGTSTTGSIIDMSPSRSIDVVIGNVYASASSTNNAITFAGNSNIKVDKIILCKSARPANENTIFPFRLTANNSKINIGEINVNSPGSQTQDGENNTVRIDSITLTSASTSSFFQGSSDNNVFFIGTSNIGVPLVSFSSSIVTFNSKVYFHNFNGAIGEFRAYVTDGKTSPGYFELQGTDVFTEGSKAVRFTNGSYGLTDGAQGRVFDLKLASAAAEANKLVTVTARVKRNSANVITGIYIPGANGFLPGYSTNQTATVTSTGSWDLLTITFTPTQNCVFDVFAFITPNGIVSPNCVWDTLTISQAA